MLDRLKLVSLTANKELTDEIAKILGVEVMGSEVTHFADGEILFEGKQSFRGDNVYVIQSTCAPVTDRLMEVLICCDALKRASAKSINLIMPYFGYARQDRKAKARQPITAKLVADLLETAGAERVVMFDLHTPQIAGFFNIPVDDVSLIPLFYSYIVDLNLDDIVCVSPDHGAMGRTLKLAERLNAPIAIVDKRRPKPNVAEVMALVGDVKDKNCIVVDDIVDTAGSLCAVANKLKEQGAKGVYACITHGVLSGPAIQRIQDSAITKLFISDSIPQPEEKKIDKIQVVSSAELLADIIEALETGKSLSFVHKTFAKEQYKKK